MDRIRELRDNRRTRPASTSTTRSTRRSRTIITSGTTLISVMVLYLYGGEGVREFAYVMLCGLIVGTYSSIAVAALVWVRSTDPHADKARLRGLAPVTVVPPRPPGGVQSSGQFRLSHRGGSPIMRRRPEPRRSRAWTVRTRRP